MDWDWDDIRYFVAVAKAGSITGAARHLGVNHSTVSRRIRGFEETLGVRLFERLSGGYVLTTAGEDMLPRAQQMAEQADAIAHDVLGRDRALRGDIHVTTADAMATRFVMPHVAHFAQTFPDVNVHLSVSNAYLNLTQREADIAIRATNAPPENLIGTRVARLAFAVYGTRRYLATLARSGEAPQLVAPIGGMPLRGWVERTYPDLSRVLYVDEANLTLAALKQGVGVGLMPCFMGDLQPELRRYREPDDDVRLDLWILTHPGLRATVRVRAFRDFFVDALANDLDLLEGRRPVCL